MVYGTMMVLRLNELVGRIEDFEPQGLQRLVEQHDTILAAAESADLFAVLPDDQAEALRAFLDTIPASIDAAVLAALRSGLERGVRAQFTWAPAYDFEVRIWESSDGANGLLNIYLASPHPPEPGSGS